MPNLLIHLLLALRNRANIALLTLTALMAILAPTPASAQTTPTFGTATVPDTTYTVNVAVSDTLPAAGTGALTYTLTPALPAGLTYKAATSGHGGILAGVPTTVASATTYTLTATDASNATATLTFTLSVTAIVTIPDDSLRAVIESSLGKSAGATITNVDMSRLTRLVAPNQVPAITDLTGLAFATNLTDLRLHNNKIRDISALSGLTSLHSLRLQRNRISDLEPLVRNTGWSRGAFVNVQGNPLSAESLNTHIPTLESRGVRISFDRLTLRPVTIADDSLRAVIEDRLDLSIAAGDTITNADMLGLFQLVAPNKGIRDLTGLEFATNLDTLDLRNNNITAIDSLSGLTNLSSLSLDNNLISDLSPLTLNTGLGRGDHVDVRGNPLSAASRTTHIPDLTRRRVSVTFDSRSWAPLELVSGDGQTGRAGEVLRDSFVVKVRSVTDTTYAYRNLPVTFSIAAGGGRLSTTSDTTDSNGLASTLLRLGTTGMDTVEAFVEGVNDTLIFSTVPIRVTIPDTSLRKVIESSLGKARNAPITEVEMLGLTQLTATGHAITDLTGLEFATNLSRLGLRGNTITAIDSLAGLTNLSNLDLRSNTITDISPLAGLTNVDTLLLHENTITDISPLAGLTNLSFLWLYNNTITDISPLAGLDSLSSLSLSGNTIADISPLSGLDSLSILYLRNNRISDLSPLTSNTGLVGSGDLVDVRGNPLNRASVSTHIPTLERRGVTVLFDPLRIMSVTIADDSLRAVVLDSLDKTNTDTIWSSDMSGLTRLDAPNKGIRDLTGLEFATTLDTLDLSNNNITAIDSLSGLTNLSFLSLDNNRISDLSPLTLNTGLGSGDLVDVRGNPLSAASRTTYIPTLTSSSRGVTVLFDNLAEARLRPVSGDGQTGIARTPLAKPFVVKVRRAIVQNATDTMHVYRNLPVTFSVAAGGGTLSATSDTTDSNGRAQTLLTLGTTVGMDTVKAFVEGASDTLIFSTLSPRSVTISDDSLRAVVLDSLGKTNTDTIWSSDMSGLTRLDAPNKGITDLAGLEFATTLDTLDLSNNNITAIDSLSGLTNLSRLYLRDNRISDLSPLTSNTGLGSGDLVDVRGNPLSAASRTTYIPTLTSSSRGVTVLFDNLAEARLRPVSGDGQTGIARTPLAKPFVVKVRRAIVQNATDTMHVYRNLPVTFSVAAGGGTLSTTSDTTDSNGLARTLLTLGATAGMDTVKAFVEGATDTLIFTTMPIRSVTIPDANLRAVIEGSLNKSAGDTITNVDMSRLTLFAAGGGGITDLTGLEFATNLFDLGLSNNNITDISPLSGLTNLSSLGLHYNDITAISPLSGLTNLSRLDLDNNTITDISPLSGLTNLSWLSLGNTNITDISPLSGLTNLSYLVLDGTITDISPLSSLTNLSTLFLSNNTITDISALSGLTNLSWLFLGGTNISDIAPLSGLTNLSLLSLESTNISDIAPLSGLTNLRELDLSWNNIADISPLSGLTNLSRLSLQNNNIADISALSDLVNVTPLYLDNNRISDLSPLTSNTGWGRGYSVYVYVRGNPLSPESRTTHIPDLTSRRFAVSFDRLSEARLMKISGDGQTGTARAALADSFVVKVRRANVQSANDTMHVYRHLPVTFSVAAGSGTLSATSDTTDSNGLARTLLTLGTTAGTDTVRAFVEGASDTSFFIFTTLPPRPVTIPDANLRPVIEDSLGKSDGATITNAEMLGLTRLVAPNKGITDLTGLEFATNLDTLDLSNNRISNIDSLAGLTRLKKLSLGGNRIADISSLARLTDLTWLWLSYNAIADIDSLANLTHLTWLGLGGNRISNIASLAGLTHLTRLGLSNNAIADIDSLAGLTRLKKLSLDGNRIADIDSLARLTDLTWLGLSNNRISNLSPLTSNTGLGSGDQVDVRGNPLSTASRTTHIPTLQSKSVTVTFDNLTGLSLVKVSGEGQIGTVSAALANPFVVKVEDQNRRGYAGLPVTFSVTAGGGSLSASTDTTDATGQAETILTLGPTAHTHTCSVSVAGLSQTLTFTATLPTPDFDGNGRVNFADFMALASKMGAVQGRGSYEVKYDLDSDGVIGMGDFRILTSRFGDGKFDDAK